VEVGGGRGVPAEARRQGAAAVGALGIGGEGGRHGGGGVGGPGGETHRPAEDFAEDRQVAHHHRHSGGQRLHGGQAEALLGGQEREDRGARHQGGQFVVVDGAEDAGL